VQVQDLDLIEAPAIQHKFHQLTRQRMPVRGVEVEVLAADEYVFGVRCFENHDAARAQYSHHFTHERDENIKRNMLDDVKTGDCAGRPIRKTTQMSYEIFFANVQAASAALFDLNTIRVDAVRFDSGLTQEFQPFAPAATKIDDRCALVDVCQVNLESLFNVFASAAKSIFQFCVKGVEMMCVDGHRLNCG